MHSFLPSIGFTNIKNRQQLEPIYRQILESPDRKFISTISADTCLVAKTLGRDLEYRL